MTISLKHSFTNPKADGADATITRPSDWNAEHGFTMASGFVLGRATAGTGAVEELAATATGRTILSASESGSWTPVITYSTTGDLSLAYTAQVGSYFRLASRVFVRCHVAFTPTYTTASGVVTVEGLPFTAAAGTARYPLTVGRLDNVDWQTVDLQINAAVSTGQSVIRYYAMRDVTTDTQINHVRVPSGIAYIFEVSGWYGL